MREIIALCAEEISVNWKWNRWSTGKKKKEKSTMFTEENFLSTLLGNISQISLVLDFSLFPREVNCFLSHEELPQHLTYSFPSDADQTVSNEHLSPWDPHSLWSIMGNGISERHCSFPPWKCLQHCIWWNYDLYKEKKKKMSQTGYGEHLFIWTLVGCALWAWEPTIYSRQKIRHS